jgi:hypothetical protein
MTRHHTVLRGQGSLRYRHIIGQRDRRVLDDGHRVPILLQRVIHALPSRAVDEPYVYEHHVLNTAICFACDIQTSWEPSPMRWLRP